jgi:hypothetical protein
MDDRTPCPELNFFALGTHHKTGLTVQPEIEHAILKAV